MSAPAGEYPEFRGDWSDEIDAEKVIHTFWYPDGPHSSDTIVSAAAAIDYLTHYLARATFRGPTKGPRLYRVVGELSSAVGRLDQVLDQLSRHAGNLATDRTLYDDRRDRPASVTAGDLQGALDAARVALGPLAAAFRAAHSASGHLGHDVVADDD